MSKLTPSIIVFLLGLGAGLGVRWVVADAITNNENHDWSVHHGSSPQGFYAIKLDHHTGETWLLDSRARGPDWKELSVSK